MFKALRQKIGQYTRAALATAFQHSGVAALYLCSSTLLAGILTAVLLSYHWDIDREKWYRAFAILQGIELAEIQQAERDRIAEMSFEEVLARRAEQERQEEFSQITQRATAFQLPPADPQPPPPPPPSDTERIGAYERRIQADLDQTSADGLAELTQTLSRGNPEWAKEVIRSLWKEGHNRLVLQALLDLEERPRERILFAMQETNEEELKDLCDILLRIAAGEPRRSIIENAAREP